MLRYVSGQGDRRAVTRSRLGYGPQAYAPQRRCDGWATIWQTWTWLETLEQVRAFSVGLGELGLGRGDKFAIIGGNRPRLYWAICAGQALGAVPVPVYADAVAEEMAYVLTHAAVTLAVVQDQEQVDKIAAIADRLPGLTRVIYDESRGLKDYDHRRLIGFADVQRIGRKKLASDGECLRRWEAGIAESNGSDLSIILYTSGTTGRSKGVMLTHDNTIISARNANAFDRLGQDEEVIAYLPLAWVGDYMFSYVQSYVAGYCVNCPETPETVVQDRREIGTTYAFAPPRVYENLLTLIMVRMADAGVVKRKIFDFFLSIARRWGEKILDRKHVPLMARLLYGIGNFLVYGPLKNQFGLSRIRVAYTAGEAIGPEIFRFYRALGLNLKQLYGQTEASVSVTAQPDDEVDAETVGKPSPGVEVKISDNGEVLYRSPGVFVGYYKDPDRTAGVLTTDGWVHSGDAGFLHTIAADALNAENAKIPTPINALASIVFTHHCFLLIDCVDAEQQSSGIIVPHPCPIWHEESTTLDAPANSCRETRNQDGQAG